MASSRERCSSSNRGGGSDRAFGDGWSDSMGSSGSGSALKNKSKFIAHECHCGTYAILFMSSTCGNPNRLFYGCPYFKTQAPHCRFFKWLDEYVACYGFEMRKLLIQGDGKQFEGLQSGYPSLIPKSMIWRIE
ncbi:hypothetical protein PIB30_033806 [Stylosanthes scabra]|uniref:GRF-type domain-containing protein n=1 Tax=Stylosanthes scabra TaxID=79078 RepID=A0ABU6XE04_9FABA|nr:hypothetical protein [Stylosanthes scabra]